MTKKNKENYLVVIPISYLQQTLPAVIYKNDILCSYHIQMTPMLHEHLAVQSVATADLGNRSSMFYFFTNEWKMSSSSERGYFTQRVESWGKMGRFSPRLRHVTHSADRILIPL